MYVDYINIFKKLTDDEAGKLAKHLWSYVNDENPEAPDRLTEIIFEPIKLQLKRDLKVWEISKETKSNNGRIGNLKRWNKDLYEMVIKESISLEEAEKIAVERKLSLSDNNNRHATNNVAKIAVTDNVTVTVTDTVIKNNNNIISSPKNGEVDVKNSDFFITRKKRKLLGKRLETFNTFWEKFDYKKGKAEAADAWLDIPELTFSLCDRIFLAAEIEARRRPEIELLGKTPKMAQGWITARRWEDEIYSKTEKQKKPYKPAKW
ncbi:MAG TPA: hypothetical protein DHV48_03745 [Prolixibacteraceae bacterium]|nr:hypothetical protein [Prolixibacteraceae bacterium]